MHISPSPTPLPSVVAPGTSSHKGNGKKGKGKKGKGKKGHKNPAKKEYEKQRSKDRKAAKKVASIDKDALNYAPPRAFAEKFTNVRTIQCNVSAAMFASYRLTIAILV